MKEKKGKMGNLTVTKPVPNFLRNFQPAPEEGIAGALAKRQGMSEADERADLEDEAPQVQSSRGPEECGP